MTFKEYEEKTLKEPIFNKRYTLEYLTMSLAGESGEFVEKVKRFYRKEDPYDFILDEGKVMDLALELGDVLWTIVWLADHLGLSLDDIAEMNIDKLNSRMERSTLDGKGDHR